MFVLVTHAIYSPTCADLHTVCKLYRYIYFSYTRQENPTGSVVLDFSVWYCLSGTHFRCVSLKLIYVPGYEKNNLLPAV